MYSEENFLNIFCTDWEFYCQHIGLDMQHLMYVIIINRLICDKVTEILSSVH